MTAKNPHDYRNGEGFQISNITQLTSFLPKNIAGVLYNCPDRYYGDNPNERNIDNEKMLLFLNDRVGKLCDENILSREKESKKFKGSKYIFQNDGENLLFEEIQKLFCVKTCLFDPIGYHKVCRNHLSLEDIAEIDPLMNFTRFWEELSLFNEFSQKPFPFLDLDLLKANSGKHKGDPQNNLNHGKIGQHEALKFLVVSLYTCLEEKIKEKICSFETNIWSEGKLIFKTSDVGKQSGIAPPPLAEWGWGPEYHPVDNPCTEYPACNLCVEDYKRNERVESSRHWMNFHYRKEECPDSQNFPGSTMDHRNPHSNKKPEYVNGKLVYILQHRWLS